MTLSATSLTLFYVFLLGNDNDCKTNLSALDVSVSVAVQTVFIK
uniref:Uncharacterized protein n=1 Tax=Anguilla anguilla TaxID=7936 RepID=A0A0E9XQV2_ANGAN